MQKRVWVVSEKEELMAELINGAGRISPGAAVTAAAVGSARAAKVAAGAGAGRIYYFKLGGGTPVEAVYTRLAQLIKNEGADLVLVASTRRGKTLAALLAAEMDCGLASEARIEEFADSVKTSRFVFGGLAVSTDVFVSGTPVVSVPPLTWERPPLVEADSPAITEIACESGRVRVVGQKPREGSTVNLEEAEVVVSVGRGVKRREDLAMFEELAGLLGGVVSCTRPIAEEEGYRWFPEDFYIGITGRTVKPKLYILAGSSGQIQHLSGCRDAKIFVGINKNEEAPVFESSDYGIVGDLYQVVPELIKQIKEVR
ncbi:MAG TPA: electron transfer flavoprotein subunit alpha/FixB family protein [Bacillota bacterium]|nr:electron transfer flavoprotein subunit alpha/FixB family protein [Bacillota bacterium]